jgi:pyruvate kinase
MAKRTKIICTIGPATEKETIISRFIKNGMNNARLNFSHGTHDNHKMLIRNIRAAAKKNKEVIGIIADLQGPKIRMGNMGAEGVNLANGEKVILTTGKPDKKKLFVTYSDFHRDVKAGDRLLLDDGLLELRAERIRGRDIYCRVINGGRLFSHKGINLPDSDVRLSSLTKKDKEDLVFAMKEETDFIAISFVRTAEDVKKLRKLIDKNARKLKVKKPRVIVKIEKGEALENFAKILDTADAIMVARGDLAIETPAEDVPLRQKEIIALCRQAAKPVIIATQMLDSMIRNPRPTRAEVSDVANAVMDNVDCVMLSGESASGKYPGEAVKTMNRIIIETEQSPYDDVRMEGGDGLGREEGVGEAVSALARESGIEQVVDLSGKNFRHISKWRPEAEISVKIADDDIYPNLFWGTTPFRCNLKRDRQIISWLKRRRLIKKRGFVLVGAGGRMEIVK